MKVPKKFDRLTPKEKLFCEHFTSKPTFFNSTRSMLKTDKELGRDTTYEGAHVRSSNLMRKEIVKDYIEYLMESVILECGASRKRIVKELCDLAFTNIVEFLAIEEIENKSPLGPKYDYIVRISDLQKVTNSNAIQEISTVPYIGADKEQHNVVRIRMYDKLKALLILKDIYWKFTEGEGKQDFVFNIVTQIPNRVQEGRAIPKRIEVQKEEVSIEE